MRHRPGDVGLTARATDAGVYTDWPKWSLRAVLGHLCTLLRRGLGLWVALGSQQCTQMGGSGLSAPDWDICVHCCDASRDTNCDASCARWHERLSRHGVPAAPPRWPLSLGREDRLCASGAAARSASSPRRQPTRTPEEPDNMGVSRQSAMVPKDDDGDPIWKRCREDE